MDADPQSGYTIICAGKQVRSDVVFSCSDSACCRCCVCAAPAPMPTRVVAPWTGSAGCLSILFMSPASQDPQRLNRGQAQVGGTSAVAPMWAAWKSLTDGVAGRVLPFSAQVRWCCLTSSAGCQRSATQRHT